MPPITPTSPNRGYPPNQNIAAQPSSPQSAPAQVEPPATPDNNNEATPPRSSPSSSMVAHQEGSKRRRIEQQLSSGAVSSAQATAAGSSSLTYGQRVLNATIPSNVSEQLKNATRLRLIQAQSLIKEQRESDFCNRMADTVDATHQGEKYRRVKEVEGSDFYATSALSEDGNHSILFNIRRNIEAESNKPNKDTGLKGLYANEVVLKQLAILSGNGESPTPARLPTTFTIDSIQNDQTRERIEDIFANHSAESLNVEFDDDEEEEDYVFYDLTIRFDLQSANSQQNREILDVLTTPLGKILSKAVKVHNILNDTKCFVSEARLYDTGQAPNIDFTLTDQNSALPPVRDENA